MVQNVVTLSFNFDADFFSSKCDKFDNMGNSPEVTPQRFLLISERKLKKKILFSIAYVHSCSKSV